MGHLTNQLIDQRLRAWEQAKELLDRAAKEQRDLDPEEQASYDQINRDLDEYSARIKDLEEIDARNKDLDEQRRGFELAVRAEPKSRQETLHDQIRAWALREPGAPRSIQFKITAADKAAACQRMGLDPGFGSPLEERDLTKGVTTAGGFTVPTGFVSRLYEHLVEASTVRQTGALVFTTDSGEDLLVPKTTGHGAAALVAEAAAIPESDPAFGQATLNAYKYGQLIQVSSELATDSGIDLLGYLARAAGLGLGLAHGTHFATGTGTGQPLGIMTGITAGKTGTTGQTTTVIGDDLFDVYHSIVTGYRGRGTWIMRDSTLAFIRKIKELASSNQYLWQPGLTAGQPDTLLGRPVLTDPNIAAMAANAHSIAFGDFSAYYAIRDVSGVRFERSDDFAFANDLITFRALIRTDGKQLDTTAVKSYRNSAT